MCFASGDAERMLRRGYRLKITVLAVIAMTAQLLAWATHTHAGDAHQSDAALQCAVHDTAVDKAPCPAGDSDEEACLLCWAHVASGTALPALPSAELMPPPPVATCVLRPTSPTIVPVVAALYRPRGPPVPVRV